MRGDLLGAEAADVIPIADTPERGAVSILEPAAWRRAGFVVPIAFVAAFVVHLVVLQQFPNSGDEYAYLWQASAFARGEITAETPQPQEAFRLNHIGDVNGRRFCKYPPGWPLLLAVGVLAGAPGVINPLLAALALGGIYRLGCSWIGRRAAMLGVAVTAISPFFLLNAGSYHSHPSCLFALTALALAMTWAAERPGPWPLVVAGASFGLAVLIRPYTACLVGVPLLAAFAKDLWSSAPHAGPSRSGRGRTPWHDLMWFGLGGAPYACVLLTVNRAVTGSWVTLPWTYFDPRETLGFGVYGHTMLHGVKTTLRLCAEGVLYTSFIGAVLVALAWGRALPHRRLLWVLLCAPIAGYLFWWSDGGNRYGPRFYFEGLLAFTLLAGAGLDRLSTLRRFRTLVIAGAAVAAVVFAVLAAGAHRQIYARRDVYRAVEAAGLDHAVVLLQTASADMVRIDLTRNPPDVAGARVLYGLSRGAEDRDVRQAFPDRTIYWYRWTASGGMIWPAKLD